MKKLLSVCVAFFLLVSAAVAYAADVTGSWTGNIQTDNGAVVLTFTLKQDGGTLTGTIAAPGIDPLTIHDGTIDGDKVSFAVDYNGSTVKDTGTVSGDTMKLKTTGGGMDGELTLKRIPAPAAEAPAAK